MCLRLAGKVGGKGGLASAMIPASPCRCGCLAPASLLASASECALVPLIFVVFLSRTHSFAQAPRLSSQALKILNLSSLACFLGGLDSTKGIAQAIPLDSTPTPPSSLFVSAFPCQLSSVRILRCRNLSHLDRVPPRLSAAAKFLNTWRESLFSTRRFKLHPVPFSSCNLPDIDLRCGPLS
eukprot:3354538-Pleurochrysis_carterae.AAC.2